MVKIFVAFFNVLEIKITSSADDAFMDADIILLIGSIPRKQGMERRDLIRVNTKIFKDHAEAIGRSASKDAKVVVVGNPINTNAWIIKNYGSNLDPANITALMQLDQSRAECHLQMLPNRGRSGGDHLPIVVWGNHSKMVYPDISELEGSPHKKTSFLNLIRNRGSMVINRRGLSSALSAAQAIKIHLTNLWKESPHCTMAVYTGTEGLKELGIPGDLYFGMPVKIVSPFKWEYDLENISINETLLREIQNSVKELIEEKEEVIGI